MSLMSLKICGDGSIEITELTGRFAAAGYLPKKSREILHSRLVDPCAKLNFLVGLQVVSRFDCGVQRAVWFLRLVFILNLGEVQAD